MRDRTLKRQRKFSVVESTKYLTVPALEHYGENFERPLYDSRSRDSPKRIRASATSTPSPATRSRSISVGIRPSGLSQVLELSKDFDEEFHEDFSSLKVAVGRKTSTTFQRKQRRCSEVSE